MFLKIRKHWIGREKWHYNGEGINMSDTRSVLSRLEDLNHGQESDLTRPALLRQGEVLYLKLRQITNLQGVEYLQYVILLRREEKSYHILHGNSFLWIPKGRISIGFVIVQTVSQVLCFHCLNE